MKHKYKLYIFIFSIFLLACKDEELKAPVPGYITIDNIDVVSSAAGQGSTKDKITDAWVFIDDNLIGSFELPTTIPIQKTGNVRLSIRGGIFNNGMSNSRKIYPFYNFYRLDTLINPEQEIKLSPVVPYKTDAIFDYPWSGEDFESSVNFIQNGSSNSSLVRNTTNNVYEGLASGYAKLETNETFFEVYTPTFSDIPRRGEPVYLEMNYRNTHDVVVSIYTNSRSAQYSVIVLRPKSDWNKVYIDFSTVFSTLTTAVDFKIAIGFTKPQGEVGEIHLDNVKLIHY